MPGAVRDREHLSREVTSASREVPPGTPLPGTASWKVPPGTPGVKFSWRAFILSVIFTKSQSFAVCRRKRK